MAIHFIIPGQPTAWQRAASFVQRGKVVTANPKGMKEKQDTIAWACKAAMKGARPMTGALRLEVLCVYEPPVGWPNWKRAPALKGQVWKSSKPDHDNLTKQVGDALNGVAYVDDAQIVRSSIAKRYGQPARTEVRLSCMGGLAEDMPQEAFQDWLTVNGSQAQMQAAGKWLAQRLKHPTLPGIGAQACNTQTKKGGGGHG